MRPADACGIEPDGMPAAERWACMSGPAGREDAALRQGAAAGCGGSFSEPQIQHSQFKIQNYCSGSSLRRARTMRTQKRTREAGLRGAEAAARSVLTDRKAAPKIRRPGRIKLPLASALDFSYL